MPNYYCSTRNPIARAGVLRKLMSMGYVLFKDPQMSARYTVSDYFTRWPAHIWPVVMVRFDGSFAKEPTIDLLQSSHNVPSDAIKVSSATLKGIPMVSRIETVDSKPNLPVFPNPAKDSITYQKADGSVGDYVISNPIELQPDRMTCYAFGQGRKSGIKTFIKDRIQSFAQVP